MAIKIKIRENKNITEFFGRKKNKKIKTRDPYVGSVHVHDTKANIAILLSHYFNIDEETEAQYAEIIYDSIKNSLDSERFLARLQQETGVDALPDVENGESFLPGDNPETQDYSLWFQDLIVGTFIQQLSEITAPGIAYVRLNEEFPDDITEAIEREYIRRFNKPDSVPRKMKLSHWCDFAACSDVTTSDSEEQDGTDPEEGEEETPPDPEEETTSPIEDEESGNEDDEGIPIYKYGSRAAAGEDGKRAEPLIAKLMKAGLPKSVVNTVVRGIVKDLKASNVPFYESKEFLVQVLTEQLLLEKKPSRADRAKNNEKLAKAKNSKTPVVVQMDAGAWTAQNADGQQKKFHQLSHGNNLSAAKKAAIAWSKSKEGTEDENLPGVGGLPGVTGLPAEKEKAGESDPRDCVGKTSTNEDDPCFYGKFVPAIINKDLAVYKAAAAKVSAPEAEAVLRDPIDNEEVEKRQKVAYLKFKEPPLDWFEIGNLVDSSKNWKEVWSGTRGNGFADGLSRVEKMAWFALSFHILFPNGKPKSPYIDMSHSSAGWDGAVAGHVPAAAAAKAADVASGQGTAQQDMFKGYADGFIKDVKKLISKLKRFQKDALRRNEVLKKAAIAKAKLKSGERGGGQIQLSVLNQQLDTISGPGLKGRDSKIVGGKRTPGKPVMKKNKETGKMEPARDKNGNIMYVGASRDQKSLALKTAQDHLKPFLKKYGLSLSEDVIKNLSKSLVESYINLRVRKQKTREKEVEIFKRAIILELKNRGLIR